MSRDAGGIHENIKIAFFQKLVDAGIPLRNPGPGRVSLSTLGNDVANGNKLRPTDLMNVRRLLSARKITAANNGNLPGFHLAPLLKSIGWFYSKRLPERGEALFSGKRKAKKEP